MKLTLELHFEPGEAVWRSYHITESTVITMDRAGTLHDIQYKVLDGEDHTDTFVTIVVGGEPLLLGALLESGAPLPPTYFKAGAEIEVILGSLPPHHLMSLDYIDNHRRVILRPHVAHTTLSRSDLIDLIEYLGEHADHMSD